MLKSKYWFLLLALTTHSLFALTTLTVTKNTDDNPGGEGETGDLRYTLNTMNRNLNQSADDYQIQFNTPMTIQLNGNLPLINNSPNQSHITIGNADPTSTVIIDGANTYRGFFIPNGQVTIRNINFQNMLAKGGDGGNGISGGGGGLGAGGAIYAPQTFLYGSNPEVTLINVSINHSVATGGNGGNYQITSSTGLEGGGGGGGFGGNGGSIITYGTTGGAGGGGFGGIGGDITLSTNSPLGGGGGGGGGIGSMATLGTVVNLGNGGSDVSAGLDGNGYGLSLTAGAGGGGYSGGNYAGGGGGGGDLLASFGSGGGGGGGDGGVNGSKPQGNIPLQPNRLTDSASPSGGNGVDGAGGGGGGIVVNGPSNQIDGKAGSGGYGGGGGGGAGAGFSDTGYTVQGGVGGLGGGGGGGGVNINGSISAEGGNSTGGGGGGGGGPSNGFNASGGIDTGLLGGGAGGAGADSVGSSVGGGGGGGGSGLGGAIFVDSGLNFTIQALTTTPTIFQTANTAVNAGSGGSGSSAGTNGSALGNSIFLRAGSSLTFLAQEAGDLLTLGDGVSFVDDNSFSAAGTSVQVRGNGTVIYNGSSDYQGAITINNANFKVNGHINNSNVSVCRNAGFSSQKGTLSGAGSLTGNVFANSGIISPDTGATLTLGSLTLTSSSVVHSKIDANSTAAVVAVNGSATLAGTLEIDLDSHAQTGQYTLLTSSGISGTFDSVTFTSGQTPDYTLSYLPAGAPTYVQLNFTGYPSSVDIPATVNGSPIINPAVVCCGRPVILGPLPVPGSGPTVYTVTQRTGNVECKIEQTKTQTYLKMHGTKGSCTIVGTKDGITSNPLTVTAT